MAGMRTAREMKHRLLTAGTPPANVDFQVLTSIYCQKRIKVNVKSKRITIQLV